MFNIRFRLGAILGVNQTVSWGTTFYLPAIIAAPVAASFAASGFAVLGAFSWALLVTGACAPRVGKWIDHHGGRGALLASIVVIASGQVVLAISHGLILWYLGWTIIGVGMAMGLYDAAFATVGGLLGEEAGPSITGITLVAGFSSTVFWTLGATLIGSVSWRGLLVAYAGLMVAVNLPMVWLFVPPAPPRPAQTTLAGPVPRAPAHRRALVLLGGFFALRWFISSALAVNALMLFQRTGLTPGEAVGVAALIGPGQVAGRLLEYAIGARVGVLAKARIAALLLPLAACFLLLGGPVAATGFAVLYGMSNGIMTINRGTLPLAIFGPQGYATILGWLAVPVLLAQATAPTLTAPLIAALPALDVFLISGAAGAAAVLFLMPLRVPATR